MSIPATVKVGALTYTVLSDVEKIREASGRADISDDAEWVAYSDHDALLIGINPNVPECNQKRDLLHELIHCCLRYSGVEPNAYARIVAKAKHRHGGYTVEEFMVAAASGPLLGVLVDNPSLVKWLTAS